MDNLMNLLSKDPFEQIGIHSSWITMILIVLVLVLLIVILVQAGRMKFLQRRYDLFMRGKDAETLEDNIVDIYRRLQSFQNKDMANKDVMKVLNRSLAGTIQKTGLVKYNAFEGMGGQSSFALTLLNMDNSGYILNAMHSRTSCYVYIKEIRNGRPDMALSAEEKLSLDRAMEKRERMV